MDKVRADQLVVSAGLAETRSQARALIMAGVVLADGRRVDKAGEMLPADIGPDAKGPGWRQVRQAVAATSWKGP